ncbi:beta-xylosidase [Mucilaginibacter sp. PPCGB 2223]|nr:beta-xylosidase [Mucilaginibacter sp. PPCGB 2223]
MVILHSKDLVNWDILGHVVDDLTRISPGLNWDKMNHYGRGIWAGSIRYYKKRFWVYFGTPDEGFFMSSASNPSGPWEPVHPLWKVSGWDDCCSFCDDDGQLYFVATNFTLDRTTNKKYNIHLFKMTDDGKSLILSSDRIIHQSSGSEANKLYKFGQVYYHFFSEVKSEGRVIMMERSKSLSGPWEVKQLNHVNKTVDREPNQGGLIQLANNESWFFTHHGTGDWEGRAASLLPVKWVDGWPIIGSVGADGIGNMVWQSKKPINLRKTATGLVANDSFNQKALLPQWEWNYQPRANSWSLAERKGFLRLRSFRPIDPENLHKIILRAGNTITQRSLRTDSNVVTIKLDIANMADGQYAGLTHFSTAFYTWAGVKQDGPNRYLILMDNDRETVAEKLDTNWLWLRSVWDLAGNNYYLYSVDGKNFLPLGGTSKLVWGSYRGDRIGIVNYNLKNDSGYIDVDFFKYEYSMQ